MLLVYTHKITPRINYIMKHIFANMLKTEVQITEKVENFIAHSGPKITYTKNPLQNEFFVRSHDLLFEQGITNIEISVQLWDDIPCFFSIGDKGSIPFDIFAASFYLLSRYEEYLPHVKDEYGRYPAKESLAWEHGFLEVPVVDFWVRKLAVALGKRFPEENFGKRKTNYVSVIDIAAAYAYRKKGIIRTLAGTVLDLTGLRFHKVFERYMVLLGIKKDPYDHFDELIEAHKAYDTDAVFFFLLGDYSAFDKNIPHRKTSFRTLIKSVADYHIVSLMMSYYAVNDLVQLKKERRRLINIINRPVKRARARYNRLLIPEVYKTAVEAEFNEDYTMGYSDFMGFRAGTCTPFHFYDISYEIQLPLKVNSFCIQDSALLKFDNAKEAREKIQELYGFVQGVGGDFITVFSNERWTEEMKLNLKEIYLSWIKNLATIGGANKV
ncbi:polysaccharide deacetylase family protein [Sinomicrobium weinanense]|uniref:Polysaccharide deacetylase family protein n=1 Tax=Sinomicrobium weinanense TaxID=2842200 RepID=A0A926JSM8_9FLAO|nr:polysaccharide deacetylase family protein [Sinomicrobium weinanense]MBC9796533.1 polysaccharide deacetylase family protein [Sinomicrobium weinanense]MBU3123549.1 polysaccharide deacetylase family protein [Sinomicrobium weinanense]